MRSAAARIRNSCWILTLVFLLGLSAAAQVQFGDYLHMGLTGNLGYQYSGGMGQGLSNHGMDFMGNAFLNGDYYNPNFLNFTVDPFYNRQQSNDVYGALSNSSGISSSVNLFSGSHFPGSISYGKVFNGTNEYGVPGSQIGLAENSATQTMTFGWSALVPNWPTLNATYAIDDTANSIIGTEGNDTDNSKILNLLSTYKIDGFLMSGQFTHRNDDANFSDFLTGAQAPIRTLSSSNDYVATIGHALPLTGNFSLNYNHLGYDYNYQDSYSTSETGGTTTVNGIAAFHPTNKLATDFTATYNDNLMGAIPQTFLNSAAPVNLTEANSFHSELLGSDVYYQVTNNLGLQANVAHEQQSFLGQTYSATQFGGSANFNFAHSLLQGLSFSLGVVDTAQQQENTGVGFVGNVNYDRKFSGWDVGGNFSYAQNTQTVLLVYTTSYYSYLADVRRRIGERKYFLAGYSGEHSGITANDGTTSNANRVWSGFIYRGNSLNVYYDKSNGLALLTAQGLTPIPTNLPPPLLGQNAFTSYSSSGWGASLSMNPTKRLLVTAAYAKSNGSTVNPLLSVYTNNRLASAMMQYRVRKLFVNAGYTRLDQTVGTLGNQPLSVTAYYVGVSRWFKFF
jgi:hypothetical protein